MRFLSSILLALFACTTSQAQRPEVVAGDLLVMLSPSGAAVKVARDLAVLEGMATGIHVVEEVSAPMRVWLLRFDPARVAQDRMLAAVRRHPQVQMAQNNRMLEERSMPDDPRYGQQWHHQNINSEAAWDVTTGGLTADGDTIVVCIIENADLPHEDLFANAWLNHGEIPGNGVDDDGNGYIDDHRGWNPNAGTDQVYQGSHGTRVAGMIGAVGGNGIGVVGANWSVKMMPVFNPGPTEAGVIASHTYPLVMRRLYNETNGERGAFVVAVNVSWGLNGGQPSHAPLWCAMYDSLGAAGVLTCGATANSNVDVDTFGDLPTACPGEFLISVTATDVNDQRTSTAYGVTTIDVGAPGMGVFTTQINDAYGNAQGTSFASPLTAGVVALLYSAPCAGLMTLVKGDPAQGARYVRDALFNGVDQVGNLPGNTVTGGRINAGTSMQLIMNDCGSCPAAYDVRVQASDLTTTMVSWSSVAGILFDLRYRPVGTSDWTEFVQIAQPFFQLDGLVPCSPYELQVRTHCDEGSNEYGNLFTWNSDGCCTPPIGLHRVSATGNSVDLSWGSVLVASTYELRFIPVGGDVYTVVPGLTDTHVELAPLEPCTNYNVQVRSNCDGTPTDWSAPILVGTMGCGPCTDLPYCTTSGGSANSEWIHRVMLGTMDNVTESDGGFGDYTDVFTELEIGRVHAIRLEPGFSSFQFAEWFHVWVDLDQSGSFEASELLFDSGSASTAPVVSAMEIPADALPGHTRMRVIMRYAEVPDEACVGAYDYGEVEDYCLNLTPNTGQGMAEDGDRPVLRVFPLPADDAVTIRTAAFQPGAMLYVVDATGRVVQVVRWTGTEQVLHTGALAPGTYTIVAGAPGEVAARGRMVIARAQ